MCDVCDLIVQSVVDVGNMKDVKVGKLIKRYGTTSYPIMVSYHTMQEYHIFILYVVW